jgi:hypothetical protein
MHCEQTRENLVAYLHHELSPGEMHELEGHLGGCAVCTEELNESRQVAHAMKRLIPVEPSARARKELQRDLQAALDAQSGNSVQRTPSGTFKFLIAPPQQPLLTFDPQKYLPLPYGAEQRGSKKKPGVAALSPSAREASSRTQSVAPSCIGRKGVLWAAGAFILLLGLAIALTQFRPYLNAPAKSKEAPKAQQKSLSNFDERRAAAADPRSIERGFVRADQEFLIGDVPNGETFAVLPHIDPRTGEMCLVLYSAANLARLKADPAIDQAAFEKLLGNAFRVTVTEGRCALPRTLVTELIGVGSLAHVLHLSNRLEIWSAERLDRYLADPPHIDPALGADDTVVSALPPQK